MMIQKMAKRKQAALMGMTTDFDKVRQDAALFTLSSR
jgi:hypothetical protein